MCSNQLHLQLEVTSFRDSVWLCVGCQDADLLIVCFIDLGFWGRWGSWFEAWNAQDDCILTLPAESHRAHRGDVRPGQIFAPGFGRRTQQQADDFNRVFRCCRSFALLRSSIGLIDPRGSRGSSGSFWSPFALLMDSRGGKSHASGGQENARRLRGVRWR